jgi:hypothetical protein
MGTKSWSKGRLYRIKNRLDIRSPFPYAQVMECLLSSRQTFSSKLSHSLGLRLVSALLMVMVCAAPLQLEGQAGGGTQACGGNSTVDALGAKTAAGARAFLAQLQAGVQSNNKEQIAEMISYPLLVLVSGKRTHIQKKQAFLTNYPLIFTDPVRAAILHQTAQCLFGNSSGAMVSNGEVWFREQAPDQWKIITINESASAP